MANPPIEGSVGLSKLALKNKVRFIILACFKLTLPV